MVDRVIACRYAALRGGHPEATGPHDSLTLGNRGRHAGNPQAGAERGQLPLEIPEIVYPRSAEIAFSECKPTQEEGQCECEKAAASDDSRCQHSGLDELPGPPGPIPAPENSGLTGQRRSPWSRDRIPPRDE